MLIAIACAVAAIGSYLAILTVAAFWRPRRDVGRTTRQRRFAILIPAHDEAMTIQRLLSTLVAQDYLGRFEVFVVADNCTDATAELARNAGATVYERATTAERGKGYSLDWLLGRVRTHGAFDAYVLVDADSVVSPQFLTTMNDRLDHGAAVIQAHYRVLNPDASRVSALRAAAFASLHYLRPIGRESLGLSCGLEGNGMCFAAPVLDSRGWSRAGLAEDVEMHLDLVRDGLRVEFAPEAFVSADMPTTFGAATSQNLRWEAGRLRAARAQALALLRAGLLHADKVKVDAAVEQLIPPLSVVVVAGIAVLLVASAIGSRVAMTLAISGVVLVAVHVIAGLAAVRAPVRTYLALVAAPAYALWKVGIWARALASGGRLEWVRTSRN